MKESEYGMYNMCLANISIPRNERRHSQSMLRKIPKAGRRGQSDVALPRTERP